MTGPQITSDVSLQVGQPGRLCLIRLRPNQDLTGGIEVACAEVGLERAVIRSAIGSLNDASFDAGGRQVLVEGPGLEILTLTGEVAPGPDGKPRTVLSGTVCDSEGQVRGGRFRRGENVICITLELVLQEWVAGSPPAR